MVYASVTPVLFTTLGIPELLVGIPQAALTVFCLIAKHKPTLVVLWRGPDRTGTDWGLS